ncbi:MAG: cytochrome c3 family protein [Coriobacteriia bacterium]|nr:cytochrome c3 family protein [Coriobacteriia bacterium]
MRMPIDPQDPDSIERRRRALRLIGRTAAGTALLLVLVGIVGSSVVTYAPGACVGCHDARVLDGHETSAHADVSCLECHTAYSAFGGLVGATHAVGAVLRPSGAARSSAGAVDSASCSTCHPHESTVQVTISRGVRMSHAGLTEGGYECVDCHEGLVHGVAAGKLPVPTMGMCTRCHDGIAETAQCDTCHPERAPDDGDRLRDAEWAITHGSGWEQAHGLGDLATCGVCHEPGKCVKCHGTRLPHPSDFGVTHGQEAIAVGAASCKTCHTDAFCASCHGIDMPHPDGFLPEHSQIAEGMTDGRCMVCHVSANCNECHERHLHPGSSHRMRPPTGMYEAKPQ